MERQSVWPISPAGPYGSSSGRRRAPPCQQEAADIVARYHAHRDDGLIVLAIDVQEPSTSVEDSSKAITSTTASRSTRPPPSATCTGGVCPPLLHRRERRDSRSLHRPDDGADHGASAADDHATARLGSIYLRERLQQRLDLGAGHHRVPRRRRCVHRGRSETPTAHVDHRSGACSQSTTAAVDLSRVEILVDLDVDEICAIRILLARSATMSTTGPQNRLTQ